MIVMLSVRIDFYSNQVIIIKRMGKFLSQILKKKLINFKHFTAD